MRLNIYDSYLFSIWWFLSIITIWLDLKKRKTQFWNCVFLSKVSAFLQKWSVADQVLVRTLYALASACNWVPLWTRWRPSGNKFYGLRSSIIESRHPRFLLLRSGPSKHNSLSHTISESRQLLRRATPSFYANRRQPPTSHRNKLKGNANLPK